MRREVEDLKNNPNNLSVKKSDIKHSIDDSNSRLDSSRKSGNLKTQEQKLPKLKNKEGKYLGKKWIFTDVRKLIEQYLESQNGENKEVR